MQAGPTEEVQRAPATPFVLNFIDDVNQLPASCQFVKRMGLRAASKPFVMCRPTVLEVLGTLHKLSSFLLFPMHYSVVTQLWEVGHGVSFQVCTLLGCRGQDRLHRCTGTRRFCREPCMDVLPDTRCRKSRSQTAPLRRPWS